MTPAMRARILDAVASVIELPRECAACDPSGGCANPTQCRLEVAEGIIYVIEREQGLTMLPCP